MNDEKQAPANGHGMTSEEAREQGFGDRKLQEGKDYMVEKGREPGQTPVKAAPEATQTLSDDTNDDDTSQRLGYKE